MANYAPLPSSGAEFSWSHGDGTPAGSARMRWENEGWTAEMRLERDDATVVLRLSAQWRVQQMLVDPAAHNDWVAEFTVDLAASRTAGEPVLRLARLGSLV